MTRDEQKDINAFIESAMLQERPVDVEAEVIIRAFFHRNPEAAYRMTKLAMVQAEELADVKAELADERQGFQGSWLSRLFKKQDTLQRNSRRDPRFSLFPQNARSR